MERLKKNYFLWLCLISILLYVGAKDVVAWTKISLGIPGNILHITYAGMIVIVEVLGIMRIQKEYLDIWNFVLIRVPNYPKRIWIQSSICVIAQLFVWKLLFLVVLQVEGTIYLVLLGYCAISLLICMIASFFLDRCHEDMKYLMVALLVGNLLYRYLIQSL